ncbi:hypothetical protein CRI93_03880 [Longimonas halophila]|uniref:YncE family protein n=1 Tax=Longimonas halophila TaxID=1469170 RepID=A0A2H3NPG3_9BACT|nr:hypothetical protein [Longimonas halophila]PEN08896.1 hypothetical protein CRI93_03880 [Longimonas halophila]
MLFACVGSGCDTVGPGDDPSLPAGPAVIASVGGNAEGLWRFDLETLEPTSVVETDRTPIGVTASPDHEHWYTAWGTGSALDGDTRKVLAILEPASGRITKRTSTPGSFRGRAPILYEPVNDQLVVFDLDGTAQFFDAATLELAHELPVGEVEGAAVAHTGEKIYIGVSTASGPRVRVYDPTEADIVNTISLPDNLGLSDVALSPDERYLFATTWSSLGPPGRFYMVDMKSSEVLFTGPVGSYAELAVTPDGRHVFIDCPAGGMLGHVPTNQVLRFDTQARELGVFIEGGEALGLGYEGLVADKITMLPGGEAFAIRNPSPARIRLDGGEQAIPALIKVDTETAEVLATYTPERDEEGYVKSYILHLGTATAPDL